MPNGSMPPSRAMPRPASWTGWPRKPWLRTEPGARANCEAFRFTEILDQLSGPAAFHSETRRRQLCASQARFASSLVAVQEGRTVLVCARGLALSRIGDRGRRWLSAVLDRLTRGV